MRKRRYFKQNAYNNSIFGEFTLEQKIQTIQKKIQKCLRQVLENKERIIHQLQCYTHSFKKYYARSRSCFLENNEKKVNLNSPENAL